MSSHSPNRFMDVIDQLTPLRIFLFALLMTFLPTWAYTGLSADCPENKCRNGLISDDGSAISILDAAYFSVITETTVGYGDIKPRGWSRLLACIQVFSGLLIAGVTVAKVTTLRNRELRNAGRKANGTWLAMNYLPDQEDIVSVTEIFFDGRTIQYEGTNYTLKGEYCGLFNSELIDVFGHKIRFKYSNGESLTTRFSQGISTLQFNEQDGHWDHYSATAIDSGRDQKILFQGWRTNDEQCKRLHNKDQKAVVREFVKSFGSNDQETMDRS